MKIHSLPTRTYKMLAQINAHKRDAQIKFDAAPHVYTIEYKDKNGAPVSDSKYMSVTKWNHSHFGKFDADLIIKKMMNGKNWNPQNVYYGKTVKEIKDGWNKNGADAAREGTKLHNDIECYYNGILLKENTSLEYQHFIAFTKYTAENNPTNYKPYRTEWMIWNEDLKFAGSIDMVFEKEDGTLMIYDWKRCKEIKKAASFNQFAKTECIDHLPDTNFWHYALQLNTYRAILEEKYDKKVSELCLVCLHPDNDSFQLFKVPFMDNEIKSLFDLRRESLFKK
jgi:ATP-dependent exoDNAse (exonuclease V) beta subunit